MDKKKNGLAVLIGIGRKKVGSDADKSMPEESKDDMSSMGDDGMGAEDMAIGDLADTMGLPEEKRGEFASAFKAAVKACGDSYGDSGTDSQPKMPL